MSILRTPRHRAVGALVVPRYGLLWVIAALSKSTGNTDPMPLTFYNCSNIRVSDPVSPVIRGYRSNRTSVLSQQQLQEVIDVNTRVLRESLHDCSTESVVRFLFRERLQFPMDHPTLKSPAKQIYFALAVLLESPEPCDPSDFDRSRWEAITTPLEALFAVYFHADPSGHLEDLGSAAESEKKLLVTKFMFSTYFNEIRLATFHQRLDFIGEYLTRFDNLLERGMGIAASDACTVANWIGERVGSNLSALSARDTTGTTSASIVLRTELVQQFESVGEAYWDAFVSQRGAAPFINYPTEMSIIESKPLVEVSSDIAMFYDLHALFNAIMVQGERVLLTGPEKSKYEEHRARTLETQTEIAISIILGEDTITRPQVFDRDRNEHDLVAYNSDICLFVESKSSPPGEPFRDIDRAYSRIEQDFRSERGIQSGFRQAVKLLDILKSEDQLALYDKDQVELDRVSVDLAEKAFPVVVTKDNFGMLATRLSLLLAKDADQPYPFVTNILDLQNIAMIWQHYGWGAKQFRAYLGQRSQLHEKVFADDEMDFVGAFVQHCGLHFWLNAPATNLVLSSSYSQIVDQIDAVVNFGAKLKRISPVHPAGSLVSGLRSGRAKVGRNRKCPCGSTVKFKHCHGRCR